MWVRLKRVQRIEVGGVKVKYEPGDWVKVGKQTGLLWVANDEAEIPTFKASELLPKDGADFGILITGNVEVGKVLLERIAGDFDVKEGVSAGLNWTYNCIWDPKVPFMLLQRFLPVGFHLLETWEVAIPLLDYTRLANTIGGAEERKRTKGVIRDLRVPVYNPNLIFARKSEGAEYLFTCWEQERVDSGDSKLSLLRAIYRAKPFLLALPPTWTDAQSTPEGN